MNQEDLYKQACSLRAKEDWAGALNALALCLEIGPYPKAESLKESIEDILNCRFVDWINV